MKTFLLHFWDRLRTSFWFVPAIFVCLAIFFSQLLTAIDREWSETLLTTFPHLSNVSPDGIRQLLGTIATSMLSLAGITFSGTLVALTLASSQFGPRLLRNFIRSRPTQITLALLLGTFVYALLLMRGIRDASEAEAIPHIAAFAGFVTTLASLGAFIYFIHHLATSLQADQIVANVYRELTATIDRFFPDRHPAPGEEKDKAASSEAWEDLKEEATFHAQRTGYLQAINFEEMLEIAGHCKTRCRVLKQPGQFITRGEAMVAVATRDAGKIEGDDEKDLQNCFLLGSQRTPEQDFEYEISQLVEIALRALSPGINDPFTAINCIDFLGSAASEIARRQLPPHTYHDNEGRARIHCRPVTFEGILDTTFHQLRRISTATPSVVIRLIETLSTIDSHCLTDGQHAAVKKHIDLLAAACREAISNKDDLEEIEGRLHSFEERSGA